MKHWNWVMSADIRGRWMTTGGYAEVELDEAGFRATLRYHPDNGGIYHWVEATIVGDDEVEAVVSSPNPDTAAFRLGGTIFKGAPDNGIDPMMILLTDGTTVLSLAHGPCSHEGNYA